MRIIWHLKRNRHDPHTYKERCRRRRRRHVEQSGQSEGDWWCWGDVNDKSEGRTADYLDEDYLTSLWREERRKGRERIKRHTGSKFFYDDKGQYYPFGLFREFSIEQEKADCLAAVRALVLLNKKLLSNDCRALQSVAGLNEDEFKQWRRGLWAAVSLMHRAYYFWNGRLWIDDKTS